jgi:hypothetical protein
VAFFSFNCLFLIIEPNGGLNCSVGVAKDMSFRVTVSQSAGSNGDMHRSTRG